MSYRDNYEAWLHNFAADAETVRELTAIAGDEKEMEDRFYRGLSFGTAGMRGVLGAGTNRMNGYTVRRATQGLADYLNAHTQHPTVVIAYDSRRKSAEFAMETALVLAANGVHAKLFDALRPVPVLSFAVRWLNADAGVVITASHNPPQYNGYKVYGPDGAQIGPETADEVTAAIEAIAYGAEKKLDADTAKAKGLLTLIGNADVDDEYIRRVKTLSINPDIVREEGKTLKIVYTPLHGSGNVPVRRILKEIGITSVSVVQEQELPDPNFSTIKVPNPEDPNAFTLAMYYGDETDQQNADDPRAFDKAAVWKRMLSVFCGPLMNFVLAFVVAVALMAGYGFTVAQPFVESVEANMTIAPLDGDLRVEYARTLQEMECYEASNRAAFSALTLDPRHYACYGLIGRNMLALGYEQEAMDAFTRYLIAVKRAGATAEYDMELDELEASQTDRRVTRSRCEAMLEIAGRRLSRGDVPGAEHALLLARPARKLDDRYDSLQALVWQAKGDQRAAIHSALRACSRNPFSARARCTLAGAYCAAGLRAKGASALLSATLRCENAQDEELYCYSAVSLGFPELALCVLRRALRLSPDRMPALYNMAVTLLRLGRAEEAEPLLSRCRALDPADVPARCLQRAVAQWGELSLTPRQVRKASGNIPFYPLLSPVASAECLSQLAQALGEGIEAFCRQLTQDEGLYTLLLYELSSAEHQLARLIPPIVTCVEPAFAERLLREVLVQPSPDDTAKRYAAAALMSLGAKPPFVVWHAGRIAEIDPAVQTRRDASVSRAMVTPSDQSPSLKMTGTTILVKRRAKPRSKLNICRGVAPAGRRLP